MINPTGPSAPAQAGVRATPMKRICVLFEDVYRFKNPQVPDIAETLAGRGYAVEVVAPGDRQTEEWNAGRGFSKNSIRTHQLRGIWRSLYFNSVAAWRVRHADYVVACTTVTLLGAMLARLLFGRRFAFYALECQVPGDRHAGSHAVLQYLLPVMTKVVSTTGAERSRVLERFFRLRRRPSVVENTALLPSPAQRSVPRGRSIVDDARQAGAKPGMRLIVANAGLSAVNCLDLVIEAMPRLPPNVFIAFFGSVDGAIAERFHAAVQASPNAAYLGEIDGNRQRLIEYMTGADFGFAFKYRGKGYCLNDRLYTPNKIYDYVAAGMVPICTRNIPLRRLVREGLCLGVGDYTAAGMLESIRAVSEMPDTELEARRQRIDKAFATTLNFKASAMIFIDDIVADMGG